MVTHVEELEGSRFVDGITYGEGPRWHDEKLWFTDGPRGVVMTAEVDGTLEEVLESPHPSGLGWLPDGTLVISMLHQAKILRVDDGQVSVLHDLSDQGWSTNDLVVGPDGSIYFDLYLSRDTEGMPIGNIMRATPGGEVRGGEVRAVATDLATPNGLGITPDGSTLVVSETAGNRLLAFDIAPDGSLGAGRVFADLGEERNPDGLCLDAEGAVWVACYRSREFVRVRDGGEITHVVRIDAGWAVATALGGPDRRTLYLIANDTTHEKFAQGISDGWIEQVRVEVPGAGWP